MQLIIINHCFSLIPGSVFVSFFSRFIEEIFSALIVLLYIIESVEKVVRVYYRHPILSDYCGNTNDSVTENNVTDTMLMDAPADTNYTSNFTSLTLSAPFVSKLPTHDAIGPINQPNTAFFCTLLTLGTFAIAYYLRLFRNSQFLGRSVSRT